MLGVSEYIIKNCKSFVWRSRDGGKTWNERYQAAFDSVPRTIRTHRLEKHPAADSIRQPFTRSCVLVRETRARHPT